MRTPLKRYVCGKYSTEAGYSYHDLTPNPRPRLSIAAPCSQATGRFSCKPKANQACTRRMARGSCPVCQCEDCPPRVCPRDCYVIQLDAGCKEVCICTGKDGIPFALLNSATYSYQ
ncbi:hypothetical protein MTO96_045620 [Rhipicephalus appendiculatus]